MPTNNKSKHDTQVQSSILKHWQIELADEWSPDEIDRVYSIVNRLNQKTQSNSPFELFNRQSTKLHHSGRTGRVGRTRGSDIYLDNQWTDWTLAHELGHRWNNAWERRPEFSLRNEMQSGKLERIKEVLRRFEKKIEIYLKKFGINKRIDWRQLWYTPGAGPPPCGVDRNFNASEDLAESFAAFLLPEQAKLRASKASLRQKRNSENWNWGKLFSEYAQTPRGVLISQLLNESSPPKPSPQPSYQTASEDQPGRA